MDNELDAYKNLMAKIEAAVKHLCEQSQAPHDDHDRIAAELGYAADRFSQFAPEE